MLFIEQPISPQRGVQYENHEDLCQ